LAEKQYIQFTNKHYSYFVYGFALACLIWAFFPPSELKPLNEDKNIQRLDSAKALLNASNDSLKHVLDSLAAKPKETETIFVNLHNEMQRKYTAVDTFNNADSLINVIRGSIQSGRVKAD
jgi:chromosome condensin MukBEF ATPase and DNA-binding subunit MukB